MQVTSEMVDKMARLARLEFNDADKEAIRLDLEKMIAFVEKLNELDTSNVEPLIHMSESVNILREDEVKGSVTREEALRNAPDTDGTYFRVPKVIRK
jgi:aspartyl-tRNA(Asn)/glutamyl-tRNA(Gln) amidotransferase subunit C